MKTAEQSIDNPASSPIPVPRPVAHADEHETPLEGIASMGVVVVIGLFIFGFVFQNFKIPSGSMKNTLLVGDHVMVDRVTFSPPTRWAPFVHYRPVQRGDIIVFLKPNPESPDLILVKRAIATAGDRIHLERGVVYVNGVAQTEPYALQPRDDGNPLHAYNPYRDDFPRNPPPDFGVTAVWRENLPTHVQNGDLIVPEGKVFAMGDNRTESADSRFWGLVPIENIEGRPMFVYWSIVTPDQLDTEAGTSQQTGVLLHEITHFFSETRWSRTFHVTR